MRIYNTLSGSAEQFAPQDRLFAAAESGPLEQRLESDGKTVRMYVCGITPYDRSHLGHARTLVAFDVIRRYLLFRGYSVNFVQNVTDIDDKIIKRARERGEEPLALSARFSEISGQEFRALGIMEPTHCPRVSQFIPQIISLISRIEKNGYAYATESGVYFDVMKFEGYGALSHQSPETIRAGARVEVDERKRNPQDFALWKLGEEPGATFDSPWGRGRPGWHIECSAMSTSLLGDTLDIHGGARDLIFPHHENEIAQSTAASGRKFVRLWMHTGFLTVNGEKMAKSLGNFITIGDALSRFSPQQLRMFFSLSHYRSPIDFSESAIGAAGSSLSGLHAALSFAKSYSSQSKGGSGLIGAAKEAEREFIARMDDDFDTPGALAALFSLGRRISGACSEGGASEEEARAAAQTLERLLSVLSLAPWDKGEKEDGAKAKVAALCRKYGAEEGGLSEMVESLIKARNAARKQKDFALSDEIRRELSDAGISLEDRKDGSTGWRKK